MPPIVLRAGPYSDTVRSSRLVTVAWLAMLLAVNIGLFLLLVESSIGTIRGQMLDTVALTGNWAGREHFAGPLDSALNVISLASLVLVLAMVGLIAIARRRFALAAMAVILIGGSTGSTWLLKERLITRVDLGVDPQRAFAGNSLPSGHAAAAAAFAVGLVLVLPPRVRGVASLLGATYAAVVGVATLSSGWHRPSDVIAAYLLVGGWAAAAGLLLVLAQRSGAPVSHRAGWSLVANLAAGLVLLIVGIVMLVSTFHDMTTPIGAMPTSALSRGYAGSVATIAGAAYLMMAVVLVTIHRVVPRYEDDERQAILGQFARP